MRGSHQAEIKVTDGVVILYEAQQPLLNLFRMVKFLGIVGLRVLVFLLAVG